MPSRSRQRCRPELVGPQLAIANAAAPRILGCHFVDQGRQRLSGGTDTWPRLLTGPKTPGLARGSEQPAPVDPDAAPADLLDDRVQQLVGEQLLEVGAGVSQ